MENKPTTKEIFTIRRSRKASVFTVIIGGIILTLGVIFLYANLLHFDPFCKWAGIITTGLGTIIILLGIKTLNTPLIWADNSGVTFDIVLFGKPIFIPWVGIEKVGTEEKGSISELRNRFWWYVPREYYKTECLVFVFTHEYLKKLPLLLKGAYLKEGNKIYFASGELSVSLDNAVQRLYSLQNKIYDEVKKEENVNRKQNVLPIWLFLPCFAISVAVGVFLNSILTACIIFIALIIICSLFYHRY